MFWQTAPELIMKMFNKRIIDSLFQVLTIGFQNFNYYFPAVDVFHCK